MLASTESTDATLHAFRRNMVVAASAGTGKTHRLTALYVLLTLGLTSIGQEDETTASEPVPPDRIVATTFSRAAALEIAERVEHALRRVAGWDGEAAIPFADEIRGRSRRLGRELAPAELRARAGEALARWGSARIDTLHGVAGRIAQGHALALGLPPGARVLEEDEAALIGELAVDEALGAALTAGGERAEAARGLIAAASGVDGARKAVARLFDRLDEEGLGPAELALADHLTPGLTLARGFVDAVRAAAAGGSDPFRGPAAALAVELGVFGAALAPRAASARVGARVAWPELPDEAIEPTLALFAARKPRTRTGADEELAAFRDALPGKNNSERAHGLLALLRETPGLAAREVALVGLLEHARLLLRAARARVSGLGFGDLLRGARDGLRDHPDVARAVRSGLDVLLVDEFQDSSRVQRDLVYLLRERDHSGREPGASPTAAGLASHGLFLVGDRKQSIYGFRGADVAVFSRVCAELAGRAAGEALLLPRALWAAEPVADFAALFESHRSRPEVLAFVNTFAAMDFAGARSGSEPRDFEIEYGPGERLAAVSRGTSAVTPPGEVVVIEDAGGAPEDADPIVREATGAAREAFIAAAAVAREVRRGASGSAEAIAYRDVAILARRRSTIPLLELALARLGLPYVVAGRALFDAREVRDVAAILRLVLDPDDRLALATVLRGPLVALSDRSLALLARPGRGLQLGLGAGSPLGAGVGLGVAVGPGRGAAGGGGLAEGERASRVRARANPADIEVEDAIERLEPAERARLRAFRAVFDDLRRGALRCPPGEAIQAAVAALDLDRVLAALPRAEARLGNVDRLVAIARRRGGTLAGFVRWLDARIADDADEPEAAVFSAEDDAVRLTTVHASKGLDFPVVVLVDLAAEPRPMLAGVSLAPPRDARPATLVVRHVSTRAARTSATPPSSRTTPATALPPSGPAIALRTEALRDARLEATAREHAERCRLTYVGMTRARRSLLLVGSKNPPRRGSAWYTLLAGLEAGPLRPAVTRFEQAAEILAEPPAQRGETAPVAITPAPATRPRSSVKSVAIATTPLGLFRGCARRFRFRLLLGLDEPVASGQLDLFALAAVPDDPPPRDPAERTDARELGRAAHRVLQHWPARRWGEPTPAAAVAAVLIADGLPEDSPDVGRIAVSVARFLEGPYAAQIAAEGAALLREEEFVLAIPASPAEAVAGGSPVAGRDAPHDGAPSLALRGAIDLLVERADGSIDVVDYKRSHARADLSPYDFQLRAYALAARRRYPARAIRAGVLFLGAASSQGATGSATPAFLAGARGGVVSEEEHADLERELAGLASRFAACRHEDRWDGVPLAQCKQQHCGFVGVCHGERPATRRGRS